jgi:D-alanine-D-alanine ligase
VDATGVDMDGKNDIWKNFNQSYDRCFNVLHGHWGEDGRAQAMLDYLQVPYVGSGMLSCALAWQKTKAKQILQACQLPTPPFKVFNDSTDFSEIEAQFGLPWVLKPVDEGSSIDVKKIHTQADFSQAMLKLEKSPTQMMVEPWVEGQEIALIIINNEALPLMVIEPAGEFYDYEAKYFSAGKTQYKWAHEVGISPTQQQQIQQLALEAYGALDCRHWGVVDGILDGNKQFWLLEINTVPGFTEQSLPSKIAPAVGLDAGEIMLNLLDQTL